MQAGGGRAAALTAGFPATREALFAYDALVDRQRRRRLLHPRAADDDRRLRRRTRRRPARARRPLVRAARPDRHAARRRAAGRAERSARRSVRASLGADGAGAQRPRPDAPTARRIRSCASGASREETRKLWAALPALAVERAARRPEARRDRARRRRRAGRRRVSGRRGAALRPGPVDGVRRRSVVALAHDGGRRPIAVYEFFWRQAARWLAEAAPGSGRDRAARCAASRATRCRSTSTCATRAFAPVADATVEATLDAAGRRAAGADASSCRRRLGRFVWLPAVSHPSSRRAGRPVSRARRGAARHGVARRLPTAGSMSAATDREFADPRLNEGFCAASRATPAAGTSGPPTPRAIVSWLQKRRRQTAAPERRDLWHEPWAFARHRALLSAEWILRRRWGLR